MGDLTGTGQQEGARFVSVSLQTVSRVRAGIIVGGAILVILVGVLTGLLIERQRALGSASTANSEQAEFSRLQYLENEIAELRSLNDRILALAGIHRPLPEDTQETDRGVRGPWAFSHPTRAPRVGVLSREYRGQDRNNPHPGVDIPGPAGVPIRAAGGGVVERAELDPHYGKVLVISHGDRIQSLYGHNEELLVQSGDSVWVGQTVARLGNTGRSTAPHLHFEIRVDGVAVDPAEFVKEYRFPGRSDEQR